MAASDIDYFIREQKSKLAQHRQQIRSISPRPAVIADAVQVNLKENIPPPGPRQALRRPSNDDRVDRRRSSSEELPLVARMIDGELQHHRFEQQRRQEVGSHMRANRPGGQENRAVGEETNGVFIRDHTSARNRGKIARNNEYNEFKRQEEEKFKNRFSNKKPPADDHRSRKSDYMSPRRPPQEAFVEERRLPQQAFVEERRPPPRQQRRYQEEPTVKAPPRRQQRDPGTDAAQRMYKEPSKLDELDRQVQELRQHKLPEQYEPQIRDEGGYDPEFYPPMDTKPMPYRAPVRRGEDNDEMLANLPYRMVPSEEAGYSLPLKERSSADTRKRETRNREYNDFLREKEVKDMEFAAEKRGWGTPVYDDILMQKRFEERKYRRNDDPEYFPIERKTTSLPPTQLTGMLDSAEQQLRDLDSRYDKTKVKMLQRRDHGGAGTQRKMKGIVDDDDFLGMAALDMIDHIPAAGRRYPEVRKFPRATTRDDDNDLSGLPIGRLNADEIRRKKESYADDLRRQMEEQKMARKKELEDRRSPGPVDLNRSRSASDIFSGYAGGPSVAGAIAPLAGMPAYNTSADDAYFYYAAKDPLDDVGLGDALGSSGHQRSLSQPGDASRKVRFDNSKPNEGMVFASQDERKQKEKQQRSEYANELQRQMVETQKKKEMKKREQDAYDRKKDEEIANYNPFGKGGGGAPVKDAEGNPIADLHALKHGFVTTSALGNHSHRAHDQFSSSHGTDLQLNLHSHHQHHGHISPPLFAEAKGGIGSARTPRQTNVHGESTHARGGHGIFGIALSDEEKIKSEKYKEELRFQIEQNRQEAEVKKKKQRELEDREQRKLDEEQRRIKSEYEEELRKKRDKEEDARKANDDARKQAEDRRKEQERRQQEEDARHIEQVNKNIDQRSRSPASVTHVEQTRTPVERTRTPVERTRTPVEPPIHLTRRPSEGGQHVMNQLATMRRQLDAERVKVEGALAKQKNEVEVYDPRLQQTNEIVVHGIKDPQPSGSDVDVFEMVRNRQGPVPVRRVLSRTETASDHVEQFRQLKQQHATRHHGGSTGTPITNSTLEEQQAALIREQESEMRHGRKPVERSEYASRMPGMNPRDLGMTSPTRDSSQLQSDTAFLGVNGSTYDTDAETGRPAYDIARFETPAYVRQYGDTPDEYSTIDVDDLARKNEERMRKLQRMQSDTVSLNDPEEVLSRFMDRQMTGQNERPSSYAKTPSGYASRGGSQRTLVDESWLDPAGRSS